MINLAKARVPEAKDVCVMSVPPRTDSDAHQQNVDLLNACLCTVAQDTGATFINNDTTFRLSEGIPNDGYLMSDGLHLNHKGTNRLVKNAKLRIHSKVKDGNVCIKDRGRSKPSQMKGDDQPGPSKNKQQPVRGKTNQDNDGWKTVTNNKSRGHRYLRGNNHHSVSDWEDNRRDSQQRCWFCYEGNHNSRTCRFGGPIRCHSYGVTGHKKKFCATIDH